MHVIYAFGDGEHPGVCKIGYDSNWPEAGERASGVIRFEQARSHNPRPVLVRGVWAFAGKEAMKSAEQQVHGVLHVFRRTDCHGREWFDVRPQDAITALLKAGAVPGPPLAVPEPLPMVRALPYDDWRDPSDLYKGEVYKRLLWVFQEQSPTRRIKVIHSPLYDTCYKYAFTYNPYPVYLVAAFHHPLFPGGPTPELDKGNLTVESCWRCIVDDAAYGPGLEAANVGWLNKEASLDWVSRVAKACGLVPYDLEQPKPGCVRPRDSQITPIAVGTTWLKRVRQNVLS